MSGGEWTDVWIVNGILKSKKVGTWYLCWKQPIWDQLEKVWFCNRLFGLLFDRKKVL